MGRRTDSSGQGNDPSTVNQNGNTNTKSTQSGRADTADAQRQPDQKIPRLVSVDIPGADAPKEEKKKGRGRPKGSTKAKKAAGKKPDVTNIKMLMLTVSGIVSARPGMDMWALTPAEIDQLAEPLASIMARHNVTEATGEYADYIALIVACFIIFAPKYMTYRATKPKKEKKVRTNAKQSMAAENGVTPNDGKTTAPHDASRKNKRTPATDRQGIGGNLYNLIPSIGG